MYEYRNIEIVDMEHFEEMYDEIERLRDVLKITEYEYLEIAKNNIYETTAIEGNLLYFDAIENNTLCEFLAGYELKALQQIYAERMKNGVIQDDET